MRSANHKPGLRLWLLLLCSSVALATGPAETGAHLVARAEPRVFTLLDYYEQGRRAVEAFVRESDASGATSGLADAIRRSADSCVLLEIRFCRTASRCESAVASGVLIDGGSRVRTAGHVFEGPGEPSILVKYPGGATRTAQLVAREYERFGSADQDWALLDVPDPPAGFAAPADLVRLGEGDLVLVVGYPDEIGIDASGNVAYAALSENGRHKPLVSVALVAGIEPLSLVPWVGSIPTRGISGGPIFDLEGRLAGTFVALRSTRVGDEVTHSYDACAVGATDPEPLERPYPRAGTPRP